MKPLHLGWHASVLLREPLIRTGMIVLRLGQQTLQGEIINQKIVANNSGVCRSAWFKLAQHRRDFTSKALEVPGQLNFSVCHDFSKFLKPFQLYVALGSAGKCKIWKSPQKLLGGGWRKRAKGRTCTSGNQHLTSDQSSYCTWQQCRSPDTSPVSLASLWPIHPHFKVNVTTPPWFPPSLPLCCVFKQGCSVRELGCNESMTDGASLRRRQEDLWQGQDAAIKSLEMYCASFPCHIFPFCHSCSASLSFCCFVPFSWLSVFLFHSSAVTSLCPSSLPRYFPFFARSPFLLPVITPTYSCGLPVRRNRQSAHVEDG